MSPLNAFILCLALAMLSLLVVSAVNQRQTRSRLIARRLLQMKRRVAELDDLAANLDSLVESPRIPELIVEEAVDMTRTMIQLDPSSQALQVMLHSVEDKARDLGNYSRHREIYRLRESDAAIARTLYNLNEAGRILRRRQAAGKLEMAELNAFVADLAWTHLLVGVVSNVSQGQKNKARGDVLRAHAFYKKAQQVAIQSSCTDERRHTLIKEVTDLMNNKAQTLSAEFMPEARPSASAGGGQVQPV